MDLKEHVGKNVLVQLKRGEDWMVAFAPLELPADAGEMEDSRGAPEIMRVNKGADGKDDPGVPVGFPYVQGKLVDEHGTIEMDTGNGGVVRTTFAVDVIHSVSVVHTVAMKTRVQPAGTPPLIHPPS